MSEEEWAARLDQFDGRISTGRGTGRASLIQKSEIPIASNPKGFEHLCDAKSGNVTLALM
jgi:hypothetical protein